MQPGGLLVGRVWLLYLVYVVFFAGGTLYRCVLAPALLAPVVIGTKLQLAVSLIEWTEDVAGHRVPADGGCWLAVGGM